MNARTPWRHLDGWLSNALSWAVSPLWLLWHGARLSLVAILGVLEPLVRIVLTVAAILSVLTAIFFEAVSRLPMHSLLALLGFAVVCGAVLALYQRLFLALNR